MFYFLLLLGSTTLITAKVTIIAIACFHGSRAGKNLGAILRKKKDDSCTFYPNTMRA